MKRNRILCLILTIALTFTISVPGAMFTALAETEVTYLLLGDANLDNKVNVKDATSIQKTIAGITTFDEIAETVAAVDKNGNINIKDATAIQKWLAGIDVPYLIGQPFESAGDVQSEGGFVLLNINPEIRIGYNADGNVTVVTAENKDAEVLLENFIGYEGEPCKEVVASLLLLINDAGYLVDEIDGENKVVVIQLESGSKAPRNGFLEELESKAKDTVKTLEVEPEFVKIEDKDYDIKYSTDNKPSEFITLNKAVEIALAYSGVWIEDAFFEEKEYDIDDGTPYYELEFIANGFEFECEVNALNGKVLEFEKERIKPGTDDDIKPTEFITIEDAKNIALNDAKVKAEDAIFDDKELELDDGTPYYEIEFIAGAYEYEYEIHAINGKIIESECELIDDDDDFDDDDDDDDFDDDDDDDDFDDDDDDDDFDV